LALVLAVAPVGATVVSVSVDTVAVPALVVAIAPVTETTSGKLSGLAAGVAVKPKLVKSAIFHRTTTIRLLQNHRR
jgi:hypothetical protein